MGEVFPFWQAAKRRLAWARGGANAREMEGRTQAGEETGEKGVELGSKPNHLSFKKYIYKSKIIYSLLAN